MASESPEPVRARSSFEPGFADLPRNIFEPRYLAMTRHALAQPDRLIGMVQPKQRGIERKTDPDFQPDVESVGCAGRIISFEEPDDGRYQVTLSGLIRFRIRNELPRDAGGFRLVEPDFAPFAGDIAEGDYTLTG